MRAVAQKLRRVWRYILFCALAGGLWVRQFCTLLLNDVVDDVVYVVLEHKSNQTKTDTALSAMLMDLPVDVFALLMDFYMHSLVRSEDAMVVFHASKSIRKCLLEMESKLPFVFIVESKDPQLQLSRVPQEIQKKSKLFKIEVFVFNSSDIIDGHYDKDYTEIGEIIAGPYGARDDWIAIAAAVGACTGLKELRLLDSNIDQPFLQILCDALQFTGLTSLTLDYSGELCAVAGMLAKLPQLTEIRLIYGKLHDGRVLGKALGQLEHLKIADLSQIAVETHGVRHILSGLQSCAKLEDLSISFPSKYQHEFLTTFKKFTALKCLSVSKNCIEDGDLRGYIPGYHATNIINPQFVNMLPELSAMESLKLCFMDIDNDGLLALATVLPLCTALKKLDLGRNRFTGAGVDGLVPVVLQCPKFEWVGLKETSIYGMSAKTKEAMRTSKVRFSRKSDVWKSDGEFEVELSDEPEDWLAKRLR
jgi:hypothetical protein